MEQDTIEKPSSEHIASTRDIVPRPRYVQMTPLARDKMHFANPTPLGLVGFVISIMTFSTVMMGWGGAEGLSPVVGIFFFVGPVLLLLSLVFEWIMGNFFPMMVSGLFAVFWLSFGMLELPTLGLAAPYSTAGAASKEFNAVVALYLLIWGFALLTFFIFALHTNCVFAAIFLLAPIATWILSASYWKVSQNQYEAAETLRVAGGALLFIVGCLGWYMVIVTMAGEMYSSIKLPVGDLSRFVARSLNVPNPPNETASV